MKCSEIVEGKSQLAGKLVGCWGRGEGEEGGEDHEVAIMLAGQTADGEL